MINKVYSIMYDFSSIHAKHHSGVGGKVHNAIYMPSDINNNIALVTIWVHDSVTETLLNYIKHVNKQKKK